MTEIERGQRIMKIMQLVKDGSWVGYAEQLILVRELEKCLKMLNDKADGK